ncbi:MAG: hypothetical protein COZ76_11775 [Flavobacteriales bacterium CG_4_8_14_3_um_filter_35_10]|nr:MAG: hypothetical protein AUJ53_02840 [Flavobacteriaceae bacterium CG1_02_35_72]PIX05896.1 MAG: hypothetical protein COZ76_11775 [Flavobacteriales bacterium CG_4_8_14_3_um_filter_35_10]
MTILKSQIQRIHALLPAVIKNDKEQKAQLMQQYTGDWSKTSTKDLTIEQANQIIVRFGGQPIQYENWALFDATNGAHRNILSLCMQLRWQVYNADKQAYYADLYRLSEWLKSKKSPVKKPLKQMVKLELSKIIYALEKMCL